LSPGAIKHSGRDGEDAGVAPDRYPVMTSGAGPSFPGRRYVLIMRNGAIDIVCNLFTPETVAGGMTGLDEDFKAQVRMDPTIRGGVSMADYIARMDRAGIERAFLIAVRAGDLNVRGSFEVPYDMVARICAQYPDRFSGLAGIDTTRGMEGLRDLERAVRDHGFVGAHWYPHWFATAPDAPQIYPYYAKCCELDVPIMMQVGQNLVYSKARRLPSVARPILLDQVAIDFPELVLIGIHIGVPWTEEMIAMCWKHPNVHVAGDAYAPKHWPSAFVHYANTYGRDKVLFGTDWPVIDPERAVREVAALNLRPESQTRLMRDNALRLFKKVPR
jgi:predicted TIM-barrel fold metal-dependent hydrolase